MLLFRKSQNVSVTLVRAFVVPRIVPRSPSFTSRTTATTTRLRYYSTVYLHLVSNVLSSSPTSPNTVTQLFSTKSPYSAPTSSQQEMNSSIPITLLAGFLGAGKTCTLQNLLLNNDGVRVGVIVNDVASVNIDAKLIANTSNRRLDNSNSMNDSNNQSNNSIDMSSNAVLLHEDDTIELQNGCACCSLADELLNSVYKLTKGGTRSFDVIVVELSGVADPVAVKSNWEQATLMFHPATQTAQVTRVVTLVDSCTFGTDWMSWDTSGDRPDWVAEGDECSAARRVPELLAEQVEAADLILINKIDLAEPSQVETATKVARAINEKARWKQVQFGQIDPWLVLGLENKKPSKTDTDVDTVTAKTHDHSHDHSSSSCTDPTCTEPSHSHDHAHDHSSTSCADPTCADPSHSHEHSHDHSTSSCTDPTCTDPSHSHEHSHDHSSSSCTDPTCTDPSHSHDHSHDHSTSSCTDPTCTDPSHVHEHSHHHSSSSCTDPTCTDPSHSHNHSHEHATSTKSLGITNFVYKADRPFNANRLMGILNKWPVPIKDELDLGQIAEAAEEGYTVRDVQENSPFVGVLRSKGFCWLAPSRWSGSSGDMWRHDTAMYWSHAGKHFGITTAGKWWGSIEKERVKEYFSNNVKEYNRIMKEDWISEEFGDRRQELVFIGTGLVESDIRKALDACLCTDEEMVSYRRQLRNYIETKFTVSADGKDNGPSLFNIGGVDHVD